MEKENLISLAEKIKQALNAVSVSGYGNLKTLSNCIDAITELEKNSYSVNGNNITIFNQNFSLDIKAKEKIEINIYGMIKKS